jgi:hypothetical protein
VIFRYVPKGRPLWNFRETSQTTTICDIC